MFNTLPQTSDDVMRASLGKLSAEWFWNVLEMLLKMSHQINEGNNLRFYGNKHNINTTHLKIYSAATFFEGMDNSCQLVRTKWARRGFYPFKLILVN